MQEPRAGTSNSDSMMRSKRELLFFIENYTGDDLLIKKMLNHKKHALTYMNRFIINEDDQYEISSINEMDCCDSEFKQTPHRQQLQSRVREIVSGIFA